MDRSHTSSVHAQIAESLQAHAVLSNLDRDALPDSARVATLINLLRQLSFPGYHHDAGKASPMGAAQFLNECLPRLSQLVEQLIAESLGGANRAKAGQITEEFLESIPRIRGVLAADVEAAYKGDPAARSRQEVVLCYPGLYALMVHRYAHELLLRDVPILPRMMTEQVHSETGIDIPPGCTIGKGVFIDHGTGVVIGETCVIGDGCKIYQGVTLGVLRFERNPDGSPKKGVRRHPTLEANVTVYANATVLGGETIVGAGSTVASGVCLTRSVPPNHMAAGPRADVRIIPMPQEGS